MNISEIKAQFPEAYKAISDEGGTVGFQAGYTQGKTEGLEEGKLEGAAGAVEAERARIAGIQAAAFPGQEALVATLLRDGTLLPDAVMKINAAYKVLLGEHKDAFNADGTPIIPGAKIDEDGDKDKGKKPKTFDALVTEHMESNKCSKGDAIQAVARINPEAHAAYIQAQNKGGV